jgi:hypothetical protein
MSWTKFFQNQNKTHQEISSPPPELEDYSTFDISIYNNEDGGEGGDKGGEGTGEVFICKLSFDKSNKYSIKQKLLTFASIPRKYRMNDKNLSIYVDNVKFYIRATVSYLLLLLTNEM